MLTRDYTVRLGSFEGPMDLLLYLIRRAELDINEIALAEITDQYLRFLEGIDKVDIDEAGEFLVTAATLIEIKSRVVAPIEPAEGEAGPPDSTLAMLAGAGVEAESESPASVLVRQLLQYKAYRDAADALEKRRAEWEQRFPLGRAGVERRVEPEDDGEVGLGLDDIELYDLVQAFARIMETVQFDRLGAHQVTYDDTPIELHFADILDRVDHEAVGEGLAFRRVFEGRTRGEMVGLFIALLELVRQRRIRISQNHTGDEIMIRKADPAEAEAAVPSGDGHTPDHE
jgi:segregation and condensation protein A